MTAESLDRRDLFRVAPSQCTARSKRTGKRCRRPSSIGANVCRHHGGEAPQVKAAARRRLDQAADVLVQRLLSFAIDGDVDDAVALRAIIAALDRAGFSVTSKVAVGLDAESPKPWEELFSGLAAYGATDADPPALPSTDSADVIDAELVPDSAEPPRPAPERPSRPMPDARRGVEPDRPPQWATEPPLRRRPSAELVTLEQAAAEQAADPATRPRRVRSRRL